MAVIEENHENGTNQREFGEKKKYINGRNFEFFNFIFEVQTSNSNIIIYTGK